MELVYVLVALVAGSCAPVQAGINSQLRLWTDDPVMAAAISFLAGTLVLFAYVVVVRVPFPPLRTAPALPWWIWSGGLLGAFLVVVSVVLAPRIGAGNLMAFMIAGQMLAGIILDHFGLVGYETHPTSLWRLAGVALLITGVVLIKKF
ncbi:MAG TPA: DMT family transporter [Desulfomonilaceae bacterium]|nr:DMT family transporter [Desulfomonilaceae bacterium]